MLWRMTSLLGGVGGLGSLLLPYAVVAGDALGTTARRHRYTVFELGRLLDRAGTDPEVVYLLAFLVVVGSTMALIGAFSQGAIAFGGGIVQAGAAGGFAYGVTSEGSMTVLRGLGRIDASFDVGFFLLVAASALSAIAGPIKFLTRRE